MFLPIYLQQLINQLIFNIMKKLLLPVFALLALASCNNEEIQDIQSNEPVEISFGQSLQLYTKAIVNEATLPTGTKVGVYALEYLNGITPAWGATDNFMEDYTLTAGDAGALTVTSGQEKYYSVIPGMQYDFYAYYPQADASNGITTNTLAADKAPTLTATITKQEDIMYASATAQTKKAEKVALAFNHALAQVKFQIKKATGAKVTTLNNIKVKANSVGTMDITTGTWTDMKTATDFIALKDGTISITETAAPAGEPIMLFPGEVLGENSVTFTIDNKDYSFTPTATLAAGKTTTITVTVTATAVTFSQTVTPWGEETTAGTGTIG